MIYFMQAVEGGPIKIGKANDPEQRLASLRSEYGGSLKILAVAEGGIKEEQRLHLRLDRFRRPSPGKEWFEPAPPLLRLIKRIKARDFGPIRVRHSPWGPTIAANLIGLGYSDTCVKVTEVARLWGQKHGKRVSRQRISAILTARRVSEATLRALADAVGVEPEDLLWSPNPEG